MSLSARHWTVALFASGALHAAALAWWGGPAPGNEDERSAGDLAQFAIAPSPAEAYSAPGASEVSAVTEAADAIEPVEQVQRLEAHKASRRLKPNEPQRAQAVEPLPAVPVEAPSRITASLSQADMAQMVDEVRHSDRIVPKPRRKPAGNPARKGGARAAAAPSSVNQGRANIRAGDQGKSSSAAGRADLSTYLGRIASRVQRQKRYPEAARRTRAEGTAVVAFTITRTGAVTGLRVTRPSGHPALDNEVLAMVRRAAPFPPLPSDAGESRLSLSLPIRFDIR